MLDVTFMDGMILTYCPKAGRHVDLGLQNMSNINQLLINAQVGRAKQFSAATDKGFHIEQLIIPMHNQIALRDIQKAQITECLECELQMKTISGGLHRSGRV